MSTFWISLMRRRPALLFRGRTPALCERPSQLDLDMMGRALDLARHAASLGEVPVGAVVYDSTTGRVRGEGFNTREASKDPTGHAELIALSNAAKAVNDWRLNHCSLAVTLEPCPMCAGACVNARIGRVVYGAPDPKAGATQSLYALLSDPRLNHRATLIPGVRAAESADLLRSFFKSLRK